MTVDRSRWVALIAAGLLLVAGVAAVAFAIGTTAGHTPAVAAQSTTIPGHPELGPGWTAPGNPMTTTGAEAISITGIDGAKLSLRTSDGWTRTIDVSGATITKGGRTIAPADLKVGDQISFRETRGSDGSYKVTAIQVLPANNQPGGGGQAGNAQPGQGGQRMQPGQGGQPMQPGRGDQGGGFGRGRGSGGGGRQSNPTPSSSPSGSNI